MEFTCPDYCNRRKGVTTGATCPWNYNFEKCHFFKWDRNFTVVTHDEGLKKFSSSKKWQSGCLWHPLFFIYNRSGFYAFFQNASYARWASYKSNLLVTSYGACIESTGTPQSITSIPLLAKMYAMVPPPPISTLPSSAIW